MPWRRATMTRCFALLLFANSVIAAELFDYHSGFWLNLHHFLYQQAVNLKESKPVAGAELPGDAGAAWSAAVQYYRASVIDKNLLFDDGLTAVKTTLAARETAESLRDSAVPPALAEVLEKAAPVYRAKWWQQHDRANAAWIAALKPLVAEHGEAISSILARLYETPWPETAIRVDVVTWGGENGAYTTLGPNEIVINSSDAEYRGLAALEMIFHESSHLITGKVFNEISNEARKQNKLLPGRRDLWHALLFYMAGEVTKREVGGDYVPFAYHYNLWKVAWPYAIKGLEEHWTAYIDGKVNREEATRNLISAVGIEAKR